jgi:hypothetical protein
MVCQSIDESFKCVFAGLLPNLSYLITSGDHFFSEVVNFDLVLYISFFIDGTSMIKLIYCQCQSYPSIK